MLNAKQGVGNATIAKRFRKQGRTEAHGAAGAAAGHAATGAVDASRGEAADRHALVVRARQVTQATALCTQRHAAIWVGGNGA